MSAEGIVLGRVLGSWHELACGPCCWPVRSGDADERFQKEIEGSRRRQSVCVVS